MHLLCKKENHEDRNSVHYNLGGGSINKEHLRFLSILLGLIYFQGLVWAYTAETIAVVLVQCIVGKLIMSGETMINLRNSIKRLIET